MPDVGMIYVILADQDFPDNNTIPLPGKNKILLKPTAPSIPNKETARS